MGRGRAVRACGNEAMQLMTWTIARLGSRFSLLFEPYRRRVMHSALGRFLDEPVDLTVGLVEPGGRVRVLPFTAEGQLLANCEQFERVNSITFRGFSEVCGLRFEFNVHSPFYPQDERLSIMPAFYLEMRVNPVHRVRWATPRQRVSRVPLVIRLRRPESEVRAYGEETGEAGTTPARIDLSYRNTLEPRHGFEPEVPPPPGIERAVSVRERIVSLNPECEVTAEGDGLICHLPVTEEGSGIKWRLVWAAHVREPVLDVELDGRRERATFRYTNAWDSLEAVLSEAIETRDERLALSRRFEKLVGQAPLDDAQRHLLHQSFQSWSSCAFWCQVPTEDDQVHKPWFSVWEGPTFLHSSVDVEYNAALLYLAIWPRLLGMQLHQWAQREVGHEASDGAFLAHDLGKGCVAVGQGYAHQMEVEENSNYLLMLQAYTHWTGDRSIARQHAELVGRLARYLIWADRDASGFPSEGVNNTIDEDSPGTRFFRKQTYLAVKRLAALHAAATLLESTQHTELARLCEDTAEQGTRLVEEQAWLGDHYAVAVDKSALGMVDVRTGEPLPFEQLSGWDAYSIATGNGLLLPTLIGQPPLLDRERLKHDLTAAAREAMGRYGCGHTSAERDHVLISQNVWRDVLARYHKLHGTVSAQQYWDMQVMSNTGEQSLGYVDSYINNNLCFYPRGIAAIGYLLAGPRLVIDRLAAGGVYITVDPDRAGPLRWPLLPLADWTAGKVPVCVVDENGRVTIEGRIDPVIIHRGQDPNESLSGIELIG